MVPEGVAPLPGGLPGVGSQPVPLLPRHRTRACRNHLGGLWATQASLVPSWQGVCLAGEEEILPRQRVTPVGRTALTSMTSIFRPVRDARPRDTGLAPEGNPPTVRPAPAPPAQGARPKDLLEHLLTLGPPEAAPLDGDEAVGETGDGLELGPGHGPVPCPWRHCGRDLDLTRGGGGLGSVVAIVHLVREHGAVLGQLRGGHALGVEGSRLVCRAPPGLK